MTVWINDIQKVLITPIFTITLSILPIQWRHNECGGVSNHRCLDCLPNRLFRRISKKTSKLRVTGLCERYYQTNGEFPAQRASNAENVSIWLHHHAEAIHIPVFRTKRRVIVSSAMEILLARLFTTCPPLQPEGSLCGNCRNSCSTVADIWHATLEAIGN